MEAGTFSLFGKMYDIAGWVLDEHLRAADELPAQSNVERRSFRGNQKVDAIGLCRPTVTKRKAKRYDPFGHERPSVGGLRLVTGVFLDGELALFCYCAANHVWLHPCVEQGFSYDDSGAGVHFDMFSGLADTFDHILRRQGRVLLREVE